MIDSIDDGLEAEFYAAQRRDELATQEAANALLEANKAVRLDPTKQRRGKSKQDFGTPKDFLKAVEAQFGKLGIDLAAHEDNKVTELFLSPEQDSLSCDWRANIMVACHPGQVAWLNPPFADLAPWAKKCSECSQLPRWTLMLCPASMGSKWWVDNVLGKCMAFGIPRLQFVGADSIYPKDLALLAYGFGVNGTGYFDWRLA